MARSPSSLPELSILPTPIAADDLPVGQLISKDGKLNPNSLLDRDYDDCGGRWYKDVVILSTKTKKFLASLGGVHLVDKPLEPDTEAGTIEAEEERVRLLKDPNAALAKRLKAGDTMSWVKEQAQKGDVGFVTAIREVKNASYKRATFEPAGLNQWSVEREVGGEGENAKRRDSGLDVQTGSKRDVVSALVRKVVVDGDQIILGDEMNTELFL